MDVKSALNLLVSNVDLILSPATFGALLSLAMVLLWVAFAPSLSKAREGARYRLDDFLDRSDVIEANDLSAPFLTRVVVPPFRTILHRLGSLAPKRNMEATRLLLLRAGEPAGLTVLDYYGLRFLSLIFVGGGYYLLVGRGLPWGNALLFTAITSGLGFFLPLLWLRSRVKRRQWQIQRALPDALDMLTIGVEAGLAFESALLDIGEKWHNALTQEFRKVVAEMRVGTSRAIALRRMAERTGVADVTTFVSVLVQSTELGVSIAQVLHSQAAEMRVKRRQRAEELARQASVKMIFPLVLLIFPAMFVVILGPSVPLFISSFKLILGGR